MSRAGEVYENPVTGERAVVRVGTEETGGELSISDLYISPGFASFLLPLALVFLRPESVPLWMALANVACGLVGLFVTVGLEIPRHTQLEKGGKQEAVIRELIRYNWPRTLAITGSATVTLMMVTAAFSPA